MKTSDAKTKTEQKDAIAFKEWVVITDLLGRGEQILILRKGGIHEKRGGFQVEHRGFFLFPTLFHQQRESVVSEAQLRCDEILPRFSDKSSVSIEYWVEVADTRWITDWAKIEKLAPFHAWTEAVIRDRFGWGKDEGIFVIIARVYQLAAPRIIPVLKEYGGCKSWVELDTATVPSLEGKTPVLSENDFRKKLQVIQKCL
jgi:hypothetical protein